MVEVHPWAGLKIRYYRQLRRFSKRELATKSGVARSSICAYERRITTPTWEKLLLLADALDVAPAILWDHFPPPDVEEEIAGVTGG